MLSVSLVVFHLFGQGMGACHGVTSFGPLFGVVNEDQGISSVCVFNNAEIPFPVRKNAVF